MSTLTLRHRRALLALHKPRPLPQQAVHQPPTPTIAPKSKPSIFDRLAEFSWRLHDDFPMVWGALFVVLLFASTAAGIALLALFFGWRP